MPAAPEFPGIAESTHRPPRRDKLTSGEKHCSEESVGWERLVPADGDHSGPNAFCPSVCTGVRTACVIVPSLSLGIHCAQGSTGLSSCIEGSHPALLSPPGCCSGGPHPPGDVPHWLENFSARETSSTFSKWGHRPREKGLAQPMTSMGSEFELRPI